MRYVKGGCYWGIWLVGLRLWVNLDELDWAGWLAGVGLIGLDIVETIDGYT